MNTAGMLMHNNFTDVNKVLYYSNMKSNAEAANKTHSICYHTYNLVSLLIKGVSYRAAMKHK